MIKNERQYRITKTQARKFEQALAQLKEAPLEPSARHPRLHQAQEEALQSQLDDLRAQLSEYEALATGEQTAFASHPFDELPLVLIRARIAAGLSQKELAARLGVKEQQVQRYEATEYSSASLSRVKAVIQALGVRVTEEVSQVG